MFKHAQEKVDRLAMAIAVDFGCKATKQKIQQTTKHAKLFSTQIVKQEQHACSFRNKLFFPRHCLWFNQYSFMRGSRTFRHGDPGNFFLVINVFHRGSYGPQGFGSNCYSTGVRTSISKATYNHWWFSRVRGPDPLSRTLDPPMSLMVESVHEVQD